MSETQSKLKILCLHGYRQNAEIFKAKLGSFRKILNKLADFTFVSAPHKALLANDNTEIPEEADQRSWWFNKEDRTFKGTNKCGPAFGFEESLRFLEKVWKEQGPFDGLLGFSQGACFVALICSLSDKSFTIIKPKFVILASGFQSGSLVHKNFYEEETNIPSLHIYGENDEIIPNEMSELLASNFNYKQTIIHSGGHYFPASAKQKKDYIQFFENILSQNTE